jgi:hypothetical protein
MAASARQGWFLKGCLVVVGGTGLAGLLLSGGYWWSKQLRERQAELDQVRYSAVCDTARYITEHPTVSFDGFDPVELQALTLRAASDDALAAFNIVLPFDRFRKTDAIVVATAGRDKRFYHISGFHHAAYLHYGMLGYLGSYDCRFADGTYLVNGQPYDGFLHKPAGLRTLALPTSL